MNFKNKQTEWKIRATIQNVRTKLEKLENYSEDSFSEDLKILSSFEVYDELRYYTEYPLSSILFHFFTEEEEV